MGSLFADMSNDVYHSQDALSRSDIMKFKRSPRHFDRRNDIQFKETDAMRMGSLVHTMVLEDEKINEEYFFCPKQNKRTKEGKAQHEKDIKEAGGRIIIHPDEAEQADRMAVSVMLDSVAPSLFANCHIEHSIFFEDEDSGLKLKSRPDAYKIINDSDVVVVDLKTTKDASPRKFRYSALDFGYFYQAAMTKLAFESLGLNMQQFIIVAVESSAPFATATYVMGQDSINKAVSDLKEMFGQIAECTITNNWPGYGLDVLEMPGYLLNDGE